MKKSTVIKLVQKSSKTEFTKEEVLFMLNGIDSLEGSKDLSYVHKRINIRTYIDRDGIKGRFIYGRSNESNPGWKLETELPHTTLFSIQSKSKQERFLNNF